MVIKIIFIGMMFALVCGPGLSAFAQNADFLRTPDNSMFRNSVRPAPDVVRENGVISDEGYGKDDMEYYDSETVPEGESEEDFTDDETLPPEDAEDYSDDEIGNETDAELITDAETDLDEGDPVGEAPPAQVATGNLVLPGNTQK